MNSCEKSLAASPVKDNSEVNKVFLPKLWPILCLAILVGPIYGFKCRCFTSDGEIQDVYTVAHLNTKDNEAGPRTDEYSPLDERFAVAVKYKDLPPETELRASWFYLENAGDKTKNKDVKAKNLETGQKQNQKKEEQEKKGTLFRVRPQVASGTGTIFFSAPLRKAAWPTGEYEVRIKKNGKLVNKKKFRVFSDRRVDLLLYSSAKANSTQNKEQRTGPPEEPEKKNKPGFSVNEETIGVKIEVYNPKPGSLLRVMWHRRKKGEDSSKETPNKRDNGANSDYEFYSESDEINLMGSRRLFFLMPKARKGKYCQGEYKVTVNIDEKTMKTGFFRVKRPKTDRGLHSVNASYRRNPPSCRLCLSL